MYTDRRWRDYTAMVVDAMVNNRARSARAHATGLFTFLVGIREEA